MTLTTTALIASGITWGIVTLLSMLTLRRVKTRNEEVTLAYLVEPTQKAWAPLALTAIVLPFAPGSPIINMGAAAIFAVSAAFWTFRLERCKAQFEARLLEINRAESLCGISFGKKGMASKIHFWFKKTGIEWPPARLEVSIDLASIPVDDLDQEHLKMLYPVIKEGLNHKKAGEMLKIAGDKLREKGVTHRIDIDGWDASPMTVELVERILETQPST